MKKRPSKTFQKTKKNVPGTQPKRCQNASKSKSGGVWGAFKQLWGGSLVPPGSEAPVGRFLDVSWAAPGQFLSRHLGANLAAPGPSWAPTWGVLKASWSDVDAKMVPSWHQHFINQGSHVKVA